MKRAFWKKCFLALSTLLLIGAMGMVPLAEAENWRFGVSKPGGAWYPIGSAIQKLAQKQYGDQVTLDIGGGLSNALNALSGKIDVGLALAPTIADALKGRGKFKGKDASDLRLAAVQYPREVHWVVWADSDAASGIQRRSFADEGQSHRCLFGARGEKIRSDRTAGSA
jgi:TRAP-type uncharacterized transport system substrate-binding protein